MRVLGEFPHSSDTSLLDYSVVGGATEFTLPELKTYAVIDLSR